MKRIGLALVGVLCISVVTLAGTVITNDTGEDARGLRITFSSPVLITGFGDTLTDVEPEMLSYKFVFSGGVVEPWGSHWMNWAPSSASLLAYEWIADPDDVLSDGTYVANEWEPFAPATTWPGTLETQHLSDITRIPWESIPCLFYYQDDVIPGYWKEGGVDTQVGNAWGLTGHDLRCVKVFFGRDWMAVRFETGGSIDGPYNYQLRFKSGSRTLFVGGRPSGEISVYLATPTEWTRISNPSQRQKRVDENSMSILLFSQDIGSITLSELKSWQITAHLDVAEEYYEFPGRGSFDSLRGVWQIERAAAYISNARAQGAQTVLADPEPSYMYNYISQENQDDCTNPQSSILYVSVPRNSGVDLTLSASFSGGAVSALSRVSETVFSASMDVGNYPSSGRLTVSGANRGILSEADIFLPNHFAAVSVAIEADSEEVLSPASPTTGCLGIMPVDVWGQFLYARDDDVHLRELVEPTFARIAETGATEVWVTSFLEWIRIHPPVMGVIPPPHNLETISEADLQAMADAAHALGLRLVIIYNAPNSTHVSRSEFAFLGDAGKTASWISSALDAYGAVAVEEAQRAQRSGVDGICIPFGAEGGINYGEQEIAWFEGIASVAQQMDAVYDGSIIYSAGWRDTFNVLTGNVPLELFDSFDAFLFGNLPTNIGTQRDSIAALESCLPNLLMLETAFARQVEQEVYLNVNALSYDGAMNEGWFDTVVAGLDGRRPVDFVEQANYYEALLSYIANSGEIDGIVASMYGWADPFGPDLPGGSLGQYDLSGSVRNKPAEAVLKRWFQGDVGTNLPLLLGLDPKDYVQDIYSLPCSKEPEEEEYAFASWEEMPFLLEWPRGYVPENYWYNGETFPLSESANWDEPGHEISRVGIRIGCDGLELKWEASSGGLTGGFEYWVRFVSDNPDTGAVFVIVSPSTGDVELVLQTPGEWQHLPADEIAVSIGETEISVHVPAANLPPGHSVGVLTAERLGIRLVYPVSGGEFYSLLEDSVCYLDHVEELPECE